MTTTQQLDVWTGEFGKDYTERNRFADVEAFNKLYLDRYGKTRDDIVRDWFAPVDKDGGILEMGANIGNQLDCLQRVGYSRLFGVEPQRFCVDEAKRLVPGVDVVQGSGFDIPFKDGFFDAVFSNNVLIHIAPQDLPRVMKEITRCTRRYVLGFEYYAPEVTEINYHGNSNLLWKADYARMFQETCGLKLVREELVECRDEPGNVDKFYLLEKTG